MTQQPATLNLASPRVVEHRARMPGGFTAIFRYVEAPEQLLSVAWEPRQPKPSSPRAQRRMLAAYYAERNVFLQTVATIIQDAVIVVDVEKRSTTRFEPETRQ